MAPKPKHKKVGLRRIDAAVDHLTQYGFSKEVVVNTIKDVLKEYGGDDGWFFIEDNSYRDLITIILDGQKKETMDEGDACQTRTHVQRASDSPNVAAREMQGRNNAGPEDPPGDLLRADSQRKRREPCYGWISEDEED